MTAQVQEHLVNLLRGALAVTLAFGAVIYVASSLHWPLLVDSPVMHYVNFLMDHGMRPYQDITDNNMPGSYLTERWAMQLFGRTDLAWRLYDFFLLGVLLVSAVVITRPYDWLAGIYAGGLFALLHASEGPNYAGEREQVMTMLLVAATALLFAALRRRGSLLCLPFGLLAGMACSIKPTVLLFPLAVLPIAALSLSRQRIKAAPYLLWSLAGLVLAFAVNVIFLLRYGAVQAFMFVLLKITPAYVSLHRPGFRGLIPMLVPRNLLLLVPFAVILLLLRRSWNAERSILLAGAAVGALSFFIQQKGFLHHRYLFVTFFLLLLGLEFLPALRRRGAPRMVAAVALLLTLGSSIPHYLLTLRAVAHESELTTSLETDLDRIGVDHLQRNVMCFDLVYGCLNSLYHLGIVQNNGYTGDLLLFSPGESFATEFYRRKFEAAESRHRSAVYVVTNQWFGDVNTFAKLDMWPAFRDDLDRNYTLAVSRSFPLEGVPKGGTTGSSEPPGYRIYLRKDSGLLNR